jgi:ABC-type nitrate/sulfonate/bicarbonate transport system permease component
VGRIIIYAQYFSNTGRMTLTTLLVILYASVSFMVFKRVAARILVWMPETAFAGGRALVSRNSP